jgi:hypothetical protein
MTGSGAHAQANPAPGQWQFGASIYGWFPALGGTTSFPSGSGQNGASIDVDADDVISALKMVFMGTLSARKDRWGMFADWVYADLGDSKDGVSLPAGRSADLSLDVKAQALTLAGTYAVVQSPAHQMDVLFGARMLKAKERLDYTITGSLGALQLPGSTGRAEVSETKWDAIVGVAGRLRFGDGQRWFVPYYLDVGTGESDLTWQVQGGLGYTFKWGDLVATWRYLDYDFKSGGAYKTFNMNGPTIGATFRW